MCFRPACWIFSVLLLCTSNAFAGGYIHTDTLQSNSVVLVPDVYGHIANFIPDEWNNLALVSKSFYQIIVQKTKKIRLMDINTANLYKFNKLVSKGLSTDQLTRLISLECGIDLTDCPISELSELCVLISRCHALKNLTIKCYDAKNKHDINSYEWEYCKNFSELTQLTNLISLTYEDWHALKNDSSALQWAGQFSSLQQLRLLGHGNINAVTQLTGLEKLYLLGCSCNIGALTQLTNLQKLSISQYWNGESVIKLQPSLKKIRLDCTSFRENSFYDSIEDCRYAKAIEKCAALNSSYKNICFYAYRKGFKKETTIKDLTIKLAINEIGKLCMKIFKYNSVSFTALYIEQNLRRLFQEAAPSEVEQQLNVFVPVLKNLFKDGWDVLSPEVRHYAELRKQEPLAYSCFLKTYVSRYSMKDGVTVSSVEDVREFFKKSIALLLIEYHNRAASKENQ